MKVVVLMDEHDDYASLTITIRLFHTRNGQRNPMCQFAGPTSMAEESRRNAVVLRSRLLNGFARSTKK